MGMLRLCMVNAAQKQLHICSVQQPPYLSMLGTYIHCSHLGKQGGWVVVVSPESSVLTLEVPDCTGAVYGCWF